MNDLDLLERAYASVPEPDAATVEAARATLLRKIEPQPRRRLRIAASVALVAAAGVVALTVSLPNRAEGLPARKIIRSAYVASLPPNQGIRHTRLSIATAGFSGHSVNDWWMSVGQPFALRVLHFDGTETEWTPCGSIDRNAQYNRLSVNPWHIPAGAQRTLRLEADPLLAFQKAYRGNLVTYGGKTTFHGQPAYKLVTFQSDTTTTYLIRRDSYRPLQVTRTVPGQTTITTFLAYETLPLTATTQRLLHIQLHLTKPLWHGQDFYRVDRCTR